MRKQLSQHWDNFDLLSKKLAYPNAKGEVTEARKEKAFDKKSIVLKSRMHKLVWNVTC